MNTRERDVFAEAVSLAFADRRAFLEQACAGDAALRARIEALLAQLDAAPDFLLEPAKPPGFAAAEMKPGDAVGPYVLRQKLGEGGCGIVWMAQQEQPLRRRVALKIVKPGMDTHEVIARFAAERQALALMDHPNIAKVLDAGATESGRPFFVMELVHGVPITRYCDELALPTATRLALFMQVCHAVQHAHQKGVIHRDLKPSNILVTLTDAGPVPKVIDFGIAKATQGRLADETVFTSFEQFIGTPAYISPEQAELSGLDVDTRSDIYSLGVLLYELLTGRTPFDAKELAAAGLDAMRRRIRETEPPWPSMRLSTLQGEMLATVARQRKAAPPELIHQVRGDLDWIVMRCLEKDRTRRYPTASALADDVRHHLHDEPVDARPPTRWYRLRKLVRRNRGVVVTGGAMAALLAAGAFLAGWQALRATRAEREQSRLRQMAEAAEANETKLRIHAEQQELAARRRSYAAAMQGVQLALRASNYNHARELLDRWRPAAATAPDFRGWEWRYLWQQSWTEAAGKLAIDMRVLGLVASADGEWLAGVRQHAIFGVGDVVIWDVKARRHFALSPDRALQSDIRLACAPNASVLAVTRPARDGRAGHHVLELWDLPPRRLLWSIELPSACAHVQFSSDGSEIATAAHRPLAALLVWRVSDGSLARESALAISGARAMAMDPALRRIAVLSREKLSVFGVDPVKALWEKLLDREPQIVVFSPAGDMIAYSTFGGTVRLSDAETGRSLGALEGHLTAVRSLLFWPDGKTLATGSHDQTIRVWDVPTRRLKYKLIGSGSAVVSLAWLHGGRTLVSGTGVGDPTVYLWNVAATPPERDYVRVGTGIFRWRFDDSDAIVTVDRNGEIARWSGKDWSTHEHLADVGRIEPSRDAFTLVEWAPTLPLVAIIRLSRRNVEIWDWQRNTRVSEIDAVGAEVAFGGFSDCGRRLLLLTKATAASEPTLGEWDVASGAQLRSWPGVIGRTATVFAERDRCLVVSDDRLTLLDLSTGAVEQTVERGWRGARLTHISSEGRYAAIPGQNIAGIFEASDLRDVATLRGFMYGTSSSVFAPDATRLVVSSADTEAAVLFDVQNWERLLTLALPVSQVYTAAFSPDGSVLGVLSGESNSVYLWRVPSWAEIAAAETKERDTPPLSF